MQTAPQWNLDDLFRGMDDPAIEEAFSRASAEAQRLIQEYKGKLALLSPDRVRDLLERYERVIQAYDKPQNYGFLLYTTNSSDPAREGFQRVMRERTLKIEQEMMWVRLELAQLPAERLEHLVAAKETAFYAHFFEKVLQEKPHQLPEREEQIMAMLQQTGREAFHTLFEQEEATQVFVLNGEPRTLESLLNDYRHSDRTVRVRAAEAIGAGLAKEVSRRGFIYTSIIKAKQVTDEYRHYKYPEQLRHLANETTPAAVEAMAEAVEAYKDVFQRYYAWKAKRLGIEKVADYDMYAPLSAFDKNYTFDEAREIVLEAFRAFSPVMADIATMFFEQNWIDAAPAVGKQSGAYCQFMTADAHPYVFLNFQGKIGDVLTLAHELGHAIHTMLARPQGELQYTTPLTLAETASIFSEMLVFDALRARLSDPQDRLALNAAKLEETFATVFRQISFYRFEQAAHRFVREQGFATPEQYDRLWVEAAQPIFGDAIELSPWYRHNWCRISHFFDREFYVYAYAFGELITCCLYESSKQQPDGFQEKYVELLSRGGSQSPQALLAPLGLDPEAAETWKRGLEWIKRLVDETIGE